MINCIVAVDLNYGIGFQNQLPWPKIKEDLNWFKITTTGQIVVMGSNTWQSIGSRVLPNRINCVVSRKNIHGPNFVFLDPLYAIKFLSTIYKDREIFIIGGQQIYNSTMHLIDRFYITHIEEKYPCDKFFNFDFVKTHFKKEKLINEFEKADSIPGFKIIEYTK
jgi:dihydrofolate reductase